MLLFSGSPKLDLLLVTGVFYRFLNVKIRKPSIVDESVTDEVTPQTCRLSDQT